MGFARGSCSRIFHQARWQPWCAGKTWLTSLEIGSGGCLQQFRGGVNNYFLFSATTSGNLIQYLDSDVVIINMLRLDRKIGGNFSGFFR